MVRRLVVAEETLEAEPNPVGSGVGRHDHIKKLGANGGVEPLEDNEVLLDPHRIIMKQIGTGDMAAERVAPKVHQEEMAPLGIVRGLKI